MICLEYVESNAWGRNNIQHWSLIPKIMIHGICIFTNTNMYEYSGALKFHPLILKFLAYPTKIKFQHLIYLNK
jgi:hypothetical protein